MIRKSYKLYCTNCDREYKYSFDEIEDVLKYYPSDWVRKTVENGSEWDFCPRCVRLEKEENDKDI